MADEFQIAFNYSHVSYKGFVRPISKGNETMYAVQLERGNRARYLGIIASPPRFAWEDWDFVCERPESGGDPENALAYYDKGLLDEVGEAIEKYLTRN